VTDGEEHVIRVIIDRVDSSPSGAKVGDYFDIRGSRLMLPPGGSFNVYAMNAVFPVVALRAGELPDDDWLSRKPWICSPDPHENIVMRLDRVPLWQVDYLPASHPTSDRRAEAGS
jgi:uncharacterized repeat protein (TIGR04076 family)